MFAKNRMAAQINRRRNARRALIAVSKFENLIDLPDVSDWLTATSVKLEKYG